MKAVRSPAKSPGILGKVKKRRRPALSCVPCHQRKLKCDREFPACERCKKNGRAQECLYRERTTQLPTLVVKPSGSTEIDIRPYSTIEQDTPAHSGTPERKTALRTTEKSFLREVAEGDEVCVDEVILYKGNDFITKFYGYSYHRNLYQQFDQLRHYIQRLKAQHPIINKLRDEIQVLKVNAHNLRSQIEPTDISRNTDLRNLIPVRSLADELLNIYITRFEATHRVLHLPTLLKEYNSYWDKPQTVTNTSVIQWLLAMATALSLRASLTFDSKVKDAAAMTHQTAAVWIQACESQISIDPWRPPPHSWTMLAIKCLVVIAKRANHIQANTFWIETGGLMRSAMAAGYHREPNSMANISVFHREMRRRLWATIIELDLQASMERGMPPSVRRGDFNTRPPLNIDDDTIHESAREQLEGMPLDCLTDTSFQAIAYSSVGLRLRICAMVNNSHVRADESQFLDILAMDEEIMKALTAIPTSWASTAADKWPTQRSLYIRTMLDLLLRQQLIVLHIPFAALTVRHPRFNHSRRARLEAATSVLSQFKMLVDQGIVPPSGCSNFQFQAALTICHELYLRDEGFGSATTLNASPCLAEALISMAERVVPMIESRISVLAKGLNEYYVLIMVLGLVKSRLWPERSSSFGTEAVERITKVMITLRSMRTALLGFTDTSGRNISENALLSDSTAQHGAVHADTAFPDSSFDAEMGTVDSSISRDFDLFPNDLDLDAFDMWAPDDGLFMIDGFEDPPPIE